ncbi:hypothetical protein [Maribellus sp. YY47]|uniref:hypothetical protein n=1 Tax=Maribellus sp. YY47 TaxID=2929486 RepID=UPI0020014E53|nr:hypothetical protein [Maribellus sp. YY47]MCK3683235.1 hypothetical protein [Maribellus sp. YY47]
MKKSVASIITLFILLFGVPRQGLTQNHTLTASITNQPDSPVIIGWIEGDNFTKTDSAFAVNGEVKFSLPENSAPAVVRMIFGLTPYARIMKEDPQQLDLIFNNEDIEIVLDFKDPEASLRVIHSEENRLWYDFLRRQKEYEKALSLMENEVNLLWQRNDSAKAVQASDEFNQIQMDWDQRVTQIVQQNEGTYAAKLISIKRKPMIDAFLSKEERLTSLQKTYLDNVDFSDESLIPSSAYTDKIFDYLVLFNHPGLSQEQRSVAYKKAVDVVLSKTGSNPKVNAFVKAYLLHGFEVLDMKDVQEHIRNKR